MEDNERVGHITDCACDMTDDDRTTEEDENRMSDNRNIRQGRREQKEDSQTETEINSNAKKTRLEILRRKVSSSPRGISSQDETGEPVKY